MVDDNDQYRLTGMRTCKNSEIPKQYTAAPTFSQAFRFFRDYRKLDGWVVPFTNVSGERLYDIIIEGNGDDYDYKSVDCKTHEEAELACLDKLIEITEKK